VGGLPAESPEGIVAKAATPDRPDQTSFWKRVRDVVGDRRLRSDQDLVRLVEERLSTDAIDGLRRLGLRDDEIFGLVLPRRTLAHRRARREALSRDESDRVVRIARIAALGEQVFSNPDRAWRWLRSAKRQYHGRSPIQMVATEAGARLVEEWLYRIDEGMAA
jgi:putative toxin-antitoxin system antitoxin component (TIGR02293 family)